MSGKRYECVTCGEVSDNKQSMVMVTEAINKSGRSHLLITSNDDKYHCGECIKDILKSYVKTLP